MAEDALYLHALRKEDFLALTFELRNLQPQGEPPRLLRGDPDAPAFVIVHFPPQHVQERAFTQTMARLSAGPVPVAAMLSGGSRLAFRLPDGLDGLDYSLQALLEWTRLLPELPANALPPGALPEAFEAPEPALPAETQTAIEFPSALLISPDDTGAWAHATAPVTHNGRTELWHTRLGSRQTLEDGTPVVIEPGPLGDESGALPHVRAVWYLDSLTPFNLTDPIKPAGLTADDRRDIVSLSSDFTLRANLPANLNDDELIELWLQGLGVPRVYQPKPAAARRLMLTAAGAWADLEAGWDYPWITDPQVSMQTGYPMIGLEQWKHIAAGGRDQYVRIVRRGFLACTCNRAAVVTVTERVFEPQVVRVEATPQGNRSIFGAVAYLRQFEFIVVLEPEIDYGARAAAYSFKGNEFPYRSLRIHTRVTPMLDGPLPKDKPYFPKVAGKEFLFQLSGVDKDGNTTSFELPLMFIPYEFLKRNGAGAWSLAANQYNAAPAALRTAALRSQKLAFVPSAPDRPGEAGLKAAAFTFKAQPVDDGHAGALPPAHPRYLPAMDQAEASIPAIEQLLGQATPVAFEYDTVYLAGGLNGPNNKGEVYAKLKGDLPLPFSAEKGGGLAKPDATIRGLSRTLGPVSSPADARGGNFKANAFDGAVILGTIPLGKLVQDAGFQLNEFDVDKLPENELAAWLERTDTRLKVPLLKATRRADPPAVETRYLWKPELRKVELGFFEVETEGVFPERADLLLQARLLTRLDGSGSVSTISGRLRHFALNFVDTLRLKLRSLSFTAEQDKKMDVSAEGVDLEFMGPLKFVNTLRDILPANGFSDPPFLNVDASGITAGYTLGVPSVGVGIFSIQNIALSAALSLPFIGKPAGVRFAISERHKPFLVTVTLFGGGGFFAMALNAKGLEQIEAAIEFGGNLSLNLGVASGGVYVMAGIYFSLTASEVKLTGYLRCGGYLEVLGLISISIEFYLGFTYRSKGSGGEVWGQASVTVKVEIAFFSTSVSLTVERRFAGAAGDPTFEDVVALPDWDEYVGAFA